MFDNLTQNVSNKAEASKKIISDTVNSISQETIDVSKLVTGEILYTAIHTLFSDFVPKPSFLKRIVMGKTKLKIIELTTVYILLHVVKNKYSHYAIDSITTYINSELQKLVCSNFNLKELFRLPVKK